MKRLRVLVLLHPDLMPPDSSKGYSEQEINIWKLTYNASLTQVTSMSLLSGYPWRTTAWIPAHIPGIYTGVA